MGIKIVGVPKTIDNDLMGTDQTFGFDTAVTVATEAIDRLHSVADSHHRVHHCGSHGPLRRMARPGVRHRGRRGHCPYP